MSATSRWAERVVQWSNARGLEIRFRRVRRSRPGRRVIYFLHVGKAAGSQIKQAIAQINRAEDGVLLFSLNHDVYLEDLPLESDYFFSIREPVSRFRSGFYSRKRRGRPLNDIAWTPHEETAFARFEHANDLAEALFEPGETGMRAVAAMKSIRHASQNQSDWIGLAGDIFSVRQPIWIIRQEHFEEDLDMFLRRAGIACRPELQTGRRGAHSNDYAGTPEFSDKARDNLRRWYAQDVALYEAVETWMREQSPESG
ncbi:hypothetical protein [Aurantiacibacter spongiae]|uniref:Sulfotransferase family protein n=1 Tax=Aurantiacibacter spongiae TaxID=2488860 RepID=A0A3N5CR44_9SPHN|nr:hypothetical protein [Aurantiacibacter spongiae]RPF71524.1 hypothetical protein EG799_07775 [Aurantiacibacter spongiae]